MRGARAAVRAAAAEQEDRPARANASDMDVPARLHGRLLVAAPTRTDDGRRHVVLVLRHADDGAIGVVLNEPTDRHVVESLPAWAPLVARPARVHRGGPRDADAVLGIGITRPDAAADGLTPVIDLVHVIDLRQGPEPVRHAVDAARLLVGHVSWAAGRLEAEVDDGDWLVVDAEPGDVVDGDPETLWQRVLRRQPMPLALWATYPVDPTAN